MPDMSHAQRHSSLGIHGLHQHEGAHNIKRIRLLRRARWAALGVLLVLGAGAALVMTERAAQARALTASTQENAKVHVYVVSPRPGRGQQTLQLPGSLQGYIETPIYARSSGYVKQWFKDIGARVNKGDLLAEIATGEIEQQLAEARANRAQVQSNLQLARTSFERWQGLRQRDAVSQQELDERQNTLKLVQANLAASEAVVQRLELQLAYNRIVAPFSGVVTKRNIDVGSLVDAGNGGTPKLLFTLSQTDVLRLYVSAPQSVAPRIKAGLEAQVTLSELPGQTFAGKVVRTAGAIDPATRTLQVEINLPNPDGKLLPGSYVQVALQAAGADKPLLTVPNNGLLFRPEGTLVATVVDGKVQLKKVTLGRDLGVRIEIQSGLSPQDKLIINPPDSLAEGDAVEASEAPVPANSKEGGKEGGKDSAKDGAAKDAKPDSKPESKPAKAPEAPAKAERSAS
jgi:membrane fusion protein, multidrug efflux system